MNKNIHQSFPKNQIVAFCKKILILKKRALLGSFYGMRQSIFSAELTPLDGAQLRRQNVS